jgi:hypothetical protein
LPQLVGERARGRRGRAGPGRARAFHNSEQL